MNSFNEKISQIGVVPVIKLNNPEKDAEPLAAHPVGDTVL